MAHVLYLVAVITVVYGSQLQSSSLLTMSIISGIAIALTGRWYQVASAGHGFVTSDPTEPAAAPAVEPVPLRRAS